MGDAQYQTCFAGFDNIKIRNIISNIISATLGGARRTGSPRYGIRDDSTSLVTLSCEILYLKTWVKM